eukprot:scaffold12246_cov112-Isochrysis_galbana.AAC.4
MGRSRTTGDQWKAGSSISGTRGTSGRVAAEAPARVGVGRSHRMPCETTALTAVAHSDPNPTASGSCGTALHSPSASKAQP